MGGVHGHGLGGGPVSAEHTPSPLGRYSESDPTEEVVTVRLVGVPVRVLDASRQQHRELMHEFSMLAVSELTDNLPQRMLDLIDTLGRRYAGASDRPDAKVDAAITRGDTTVDLTYEVAPHVVEAADQLAALMDEADDFCRREQMLTLQRSDVMKQFADWYLDEFRRQIRGEPPKPWDGPLDA